MLGGLEDWRLGGRGGVEGGGGIINNFHEICEFLTKIPPGRGLGGPKRAKMVQRGVKTEPKGGQGGPRWPQGGQKGAPGGAKRAPGRLNLVLWGHFG